jgi:WD40 repeat protein
MLAVAAETGSDDRGSICVYRVEDGRQAWSLDDLDFARCVRFSPDGALLASSAAGRAHLWDAATGEPRFTPVGHLEDIADGSFSRDGRLIALADEKEQISLWDGSSFADQGQLTGSFVAWSPDGKLWTISQQDNRVRLWDPATCVEQAAFAVRHVAINGLALSSDGETLAVWGYKPSLALYSVEQAGSARKRPAPRLLKGHRDMVDHAAFSPSGRWLVSTAKGYERDQTVRLWDVASREELRRWKDTDSEAQATYQVQCVAFAPDGRQLAWGDCGRVFLAAVKTHEPPRMLAEPRWLHVYVLCFTPDGRRLLAGGDRGLICVWDIASGEILRTLEGHRGGTTVIHFSPDGRQVLTAGGDCTALVWDAAQLT